VLLSLVGIGSGLLVVYGLLLGKRFDGATAIFLATTVLTSLTGFYFQSSHLLPSHVLGVISLVALAVAILARYPLHLAGAWRRIYVICAVLALYLNVFVFSAQIFMKVPAVHRVGSDAERTTVPDRSTGRHGKFSSCWGFWRRRSFALLRSPPRPLDEF